MEIICCDFASEAAQKAFRLRYEVYGPEIGVDDPDIDHKNGIYIDKFDKHSRIYVAIRDGEAIATVRALYDRDYNFSDGLPESIRNILRIENFLKSYPGTLAISTRFAISPNHRGSLAANLVTAKMFQDFLDDGINFVFSWCAPYLFDFYSQLGFHMYSRSVSDRMGLWTPIVLATQDQRHLQNIKSPLYKHINKSRLTDATHDSIAWFKDNYGHTFDKFVSVCDDRVLEKIFAFSGDGAFQSDYPGAGIFNGISAEDIKKIIGSAKLLRFSAGQVVMQADNINDEMFIVVDGKVKLSIKSDALSYEIGPGQAFGEISMLSRRSRSEDCVAVEDTQVAIFSRQNLSRLIKIEPELATQLLFNMARSLSLKLRRTNQYIATSEKLSYWSSLIMEIRSCLNIDQTKFADLVGGSQDDVLCWEAGLGVPSAVEQRRIEQIASDKNIPSLGGMVELVRSSPTRMFIVDEDYFVIASSRTSEWIEGAMAREHLSASASPHFAKVTETLDGSGFWSGRGGRVIEDDYNDNDKIWRSVITSVSIRDRIYAVVQQTIL